MFKLLSIAGLNANSKCNWPCRTNNTYHLLVLENFYWFYKFFFNIRKTLHKIHPQHLFFIVLTSLNYFINIWGHSLADTCKEECLQMFIGTVGPVEVFLYWLKAVWEFLLARAIGSMLASSPVLLWTSTIN